MIARLRGILAEKSKDRVIVDVQGVGYGLQVPETVLLQIPEEGSEVNLEVYTHVREDALLLFGFAKKIEKDVFEILMSANGVGPKLALTVLSVLTAEQVLEAVVRADKVGLVAIPGIGKKTAERILIEIKEKCEKRLLLERAGSEKLSPHSKKSMLAEFQLQSNFKFMADLEDALRGLGYRDTDFKTAIKEILPQLEEKTDLATALRLALKQLSGGGTNHGLRGHA